MDLRSVSGGNRIFQGTLRSFSGSSIGYLEVLVAFQRVQSVLSAFRGRFQRVSEALHGV